MESERGGEGIRQDRIWACRLQQAFEMPHFVGPQTLSEVANSCTVSLAECYLPVASVSFCLDVEGLYLFGPDEMKMLLGLRI